MYPKPHCGSDLAEEPKLSGSFCGAWTGVKYAVSADREEQWHRLSLVDGGSSANGWVSGLRGFTILALQGLERLRQLCFWGDKRRQ